MIAFLLKPYVRTETVGWRRFILMANAKDFQLQQSQLLVGSSAALTLWFLVVQVQLFGRYYHCG